MLDAVLLEQTKAGTLSGYLGSDSEELCPVCRGTGWEQAFHSGRLGVRRCSATVHLHHALSRMGIDSKYWRSSFENFELLSEAASRTVARLKAIADDPAHWRGAMILSGRAGTGKTHLLVALIVKLLAQGRRGVAYYQMNRLLSRFQAGATTRQQRAALLRELCEVSILIVDGWNRPLAGPERRRLRALFEMRASGSRLTLFGSQLEKKIALRQISSTESHLSRGSVTVIEVPGSDLHGNLFLI